MQEKRYYVHHCVHLEALEAVIKKREYPCTEDGGRSHVGPVQEIAGPLFKECRDERTGKAETEADKPQNIADERACQRGERRGRGDREYGSIGRSSKLLGYLGK